MAHQGGIMSEQTTIHGTTESGWESVADTFAAAFDRGEELGASVAVTHHGKTVVDLWAGHANPQGDPWERDTIVNVYSTTKTMTTTALMMCVDRGLVDVHAPVAQYWPEFAANGKENNTVAQVMAHTSGLSGFEPPVAATDLYDWDARAAQLAGQAPWWEPGTAPGYHAVTHGNLMGEIVRRVDGRSLGTFFREEVAEPLGADFHIGFGPEHDHRCGELVPPPPLGSALIDAGLGPDSIPVKTMMSVPLDATEPRTREWRAAEIPAAGGFGNARSVARVHSALACGGSVDGVKLMSPDTVEMILEEQIAGIDLVLMNQSRFGLGFGLATELVPLPNPRTFYWGGWGGSLAIIDLDAELTVSYVMNKMAVDLMGDVRGTSLAMAAFIAALGAS